MDAAQRPLEDYADYNQQPPRAYVPIPINWNQDIDVPNNIPTSTPVSRPKKSP